MPAQEIPEKPKAAAQGVRDPLRRLWFSQYLTESWLIRLAVFLIFGLYLRTLGFEPVYDDKIISPWNSLRDVPKIFAHDIFGFDGQAHSVYYRPLASTWGLLVSMAAGGASSWLHLSALLLHLAIVILAYVFGCQLLRDRRLALLTALLFGLHPSKVESVAWIGSSSVDSLGALFFFASLITFLKWQERGHRRWLVASVLWFACAMFTKETMVLIPSLIAAYLLLTSPSAGRISRTLKTLLPYGAVWVVYMAIRHQAIKPVSASADYIHPTFTLTNLWTAPYSIWWYIGHQVMPWGLSVDYADKTVESPTLAGFILPGFALLVFLAVGLWLWSRWRSPIAAFLMLWFALALAPAVIFAPMVSQHDRYAHIASYAFCALVAWGVLRLGKVPAAVRVIAVLAIVGLWSGLTWHEMSYWDRDETLWARSLEISPSSLRAQLKVASLDNAAGDSGKALTVLTDGLQDHPSSVNLWLGRATILFERKDAVAAREAYLKVMQLTEPAAGQPVEDGFFRRSRATAAFHLALLDVSANNFVEAESFARTALSLDSNAMGFHSVLSRSLLGQGRVEEAQAESELESNLRMANQSRNGHD